MSTRVETEIRHALALLADLHDSHRVHRRDALIALGISDSLQDAMFRRGLLVRLRHGIYALRERVENADPVERHLVDVAAAAAAAREAVWAFGPSAALALELPMPMTVPDRVSIVRMSGRDERALARASQHRLSIPNIDITTGPVIPASTGQARGVAVVDVGLAALSTAAQVTSSRWRTAVFDAALWRGATAEDIHDAVDQWRHLGARRDVLSALARARMGAQTVLETFSRLALMEQGLPEPILQHAFFDGDGLIGYVDMWWPEFGVIGEADGAVKYATRADLVKEKKREDRLRALGPIVVRWTMDEIQERPQMVAERIRSAARRAA